MGEHLVINYNIRGLYQKQAELEILLQQYRPSVVALTDTELAAPIRPHFQGYTMYREASAPGTHAGAAILVRRDVPSRYIMNPVEPTQGTHMVTVDVHLKHRYTFTCVYKRPRAGLTSVRLLLQHAQSRSRHVVLGDLNARHTAWLCGSNNPLGTYITKTRLAVYHPGVHTFRHAARPEWTSTLDLLLTRDQHTVTDCQALPYGPSDHRPVLYTFEGTPSTPLPNKYLLRKADWKGYKSSVETTLPTIKSYETHEEVDNAVEIITATIQKSANQHIPMFTPQPNTIRKPPKHITVLINHRNNLRNIFQRTKDYSLKPAINAMTRQIASLMRVWKTSLWHEQLRRTHDDHRQFWRLVRTHVNKKRSVHLTSGSELLTPGEQAQLLANCYAGKDAERTNSAPPIPEGPLPCPNVKPIYSTYNQLESVLRRIKGNKASGQDDIPYVLLKMLPRKGKAFLLSIFNSCLRISYFPTAWKQAIVVPLLKPGKKGDLAEHYRPISLLSHISKVFERLIHHHLMQHCREENIIPPEQTGFQRGVACEHHLAKLQAHTILQMNRNRSTALISLDCSQAFDCVSHQLLIRRLQEYRFPASLCRLIESYLSGRSFAVRVGGDCSTPAVTTCGVPQGSVLGPILFVVFTAPVVALKHHGAEVAAYADDIGVYASSFNAKRAMTLAQNASATIVSELQSIGIKVNPTKTDAILMSFQKNKKALPTHFTISGVDQQISNSITYLGVTLDRHLTFSSHVRQRIKMARQKGHRLYHLLTSQQLTLRLKLQIYKAVIRPTLLHGAPLLRHMYRTTLKRLQGYQSSVLRRIVRGTTLQRANNQHIRGELQLPSVPEYIGRRHIKFFDGLKACVNPLFKEITPPPKPGRWQRKLPLVDVTTEGGDFGP